MDYYQGQELWNSGDKYNYPFLPDEIPWTVRALNFDLNPNDPDNRVAVKKKHSADGIPRFWTNQWTKKNFKKDPFKWGIPKTCIIRYFRLNKFRNKFFVFCWSLKRYHHKPLIGGVRLALLQRPSLQTSETVHWLSLTHYSWGNL